MQQAASQPRRAARDDPGQVRSWRLAQLLRAGFDAEEAGVLADHLEVDLHDALRLVERGCPPAVALRILV